MSQRNRLHSEVVPAPLGGRTRRLQRAQQFLSSAPMDGAAFASFIAEDPAFRVAQLSPQEVFSSSLIMLAALDAGLTLPQQASIARTVSEAFTGDGLVHFFSERELLPADVDCTVLALSVLTRLALPCPVSPHRVLGRVAENVNAQGILRVYFTSDPVRGERLDPVVCINALSAFALFGRESELSRSADYVEDFVSSEALEAGSRYYPSPDLVLYFLSQLLEWPALSERFLPLLRDRLAPRLLDRNAGPLDLAARAVAAQRAGLEPAAALVALADAQRVNGAWPAAPCFRYGRKARFFGSEALTTAVASCALAHAESTSVDIAADAARQAVRSG